MSTTNTAEIEYMNRVADGRASTMAELAANFRAMNPSDLAREYEAKWWDFGVTAGAARLEMGRSLAAAHDALAEPIGAGGIWDLPEGCPTLRGEIQVDLVALAIRMTGAPASMRARTGRRLAAVAELAVELAEEEME